MGLPNEVVTALIGAANQGGYEIEQSLRFTGNSTYFTKTFGSSGNRRKFTLSVWVKKATTVAVSPDNTGLNFFGANSGSVSDSMNVGMNASCEAIQFYQYNSGYTGGIFSFARYRDPSAWMHMVFVWDSAQAGGAADRMAVYVNNRIERPNGSESPNTGPSLNKDAAWNNSSYTHTIGGTYQTNDMYLAEAYHIDGQALEATDFGEYNNAGVWVPKEYEGTYSGNSFYLKFDPTAANGLGHDYSGLGNHWTANGFTTSGPGLSDVMSDTPTKNWATMNQLESFNGRWSNRLTDGNLQVSIPSDGTLKRNYPGKYATIPVPTTGKFYFEFETNQQYTRCVAVDVDYANSVDSGDDLSLTDKKSVQFSVFDGNYYYNGANNSTASGHGSNSSPSGDIYGVAIDLGNGTFQVNKNGVAGTELDISTWAGESARVSAYVSASTASGTIKYNFGANEFAYPPGTSSATEYFNTITYTGNSGTRSISTVGFQPDLVWIKNRDVNDHHALFDSVRGALKYISSNRTNAEAELANTLTSFDSGGFSLGSANLTNYTGQGYVAWCWKAGGSPSSNTDGSISSSVSANNDAGFSIVSYTGTGSLGTVGHGLDVAPDVVFTKPLDGGDHYWGVYHRYGSQGAQTQLQLQTTTAPNTGTSFWNGTHPTSSVFTVNTASGTNNSGSNMIAYCWSPVAGVSKFGSYSGTGADQFVECGFKPALVIMKSSANAREWIMKDSARGPESDKTLETHEPNSESQSEPMTIQFNENGFTLVGNSVVNVNGDSLIFMAFAENFIGDADAKFLNTSNLPAPSIKDGSQYFNPVIYAPDGSSSFAVTGVGFQPDLVWIKSRNYAEDHQVNDSLRGATKALQTNIAGTEVTQSNGLTSFDSDGFTVGNLSDYNYSGDSIISWNWKEGTSNGLDIVSYEGTGSTQTISHNLGVPPAFVIVKTLDNGRDWYCYHQSLGAGKTILLSYDGSAFSSTNYWNNTAPTSTVFTVGSDVGTNENANTYVGYAFAEVEGYSKFGSYLGGDGVFVHLGFRPALLILKGTVGTRNWIILDSKRSTYNVVDDIIHPNLSNAESVQGSSSVDFLSNGFMTRGGNISGSGDLTVFAAFAENPFGGSGVSPATAR